MNRVRGEEGAKAQLAKEQVACDVEAFNLPHLGFHGKIIGT